MRARRFGSVALFVLAASLASPALAQAPAPNVAQAKDILKRSIGFRTVKGQGQTKAYGDYLASILRQAGFADADIEVTPVGDTATLVARYRGTDPARKPILLLVHMDVVEAKAADWERDPFTAVEENGYIYGRGAADNKFDVSMIVATIAQLKREGFKPKRDIILTFTGDEETEMATTKLLAERFRNAELVLNGDGGGGALGEDGKPLYYSLQAGEKTYADYVIEFTDPGGHSSRPGKNNAIYRLAKALDRIGNYKFAPQASDLTRASLKIQSQQIGGDLGAAMARFAANPADTAAADRISEDPEYIGQVRTTCVATMVNAGHAENALPQRATANVNCRIFPGVTPDTVKAKLAEIVSDSDARITTAGEVDYSDASPLRDDLVKAVTKAVHARAPGLTIIPTMEAGATDSLHFRARGVPSYGVSGLFMKPTDMLAHGLNERAPVASIAPALAHWRSLLTDLSK